MAPLRMRFTAQDAVRLETQLREASIEQAKLRLYVLCAQAIQRKIEERVSSLVFEIPASELDTLHDPQDRGTLFDRLLDHVRNRRHFIVSDDVKSLYRFRIDWEPKVEAAEVRARPAAPAAVSSAPSTSSTTTTTTPSTTTGARTPRNRTPTAAAPGGGCAPLLVLPSQVQPSANAVSILDLFTKHLADKMRLETMMSHAPAVRARLEVVERTLERIRNNIAKQLSYAELAFQHNQDCLQRSGHAQRADYGLHHHSRQADDDEEEDDDDEAYYADTRQRRRARNVVGPLLSAMLRPAGGRGCRDDDAAPPLECYAQEAPAVFVLYDHHNIHG
jgi:hypothetical protein